LGTMYATVPQTQQAALDEGLFVKEKLVSQWAPIRQSLPLKGASPRSAERPAMPSTGGEPARRPEGTKLSTGVNLPDFSHPRPAALPVEETFEVVAPQSLEVPELPEPELEEQQVELVETITYETSRTDEAIPVLTQEVIYSDTAIETLYLRQTLRSGQTVRFKGHVVIVGDVHAGSEITAGGDIVVWGELRGIAHAAIDVSDGLAGDLGHILARSRVGARLDVDALPAGPVLSTQAQALRRNESRSLGGWSRAD